MSPLLGYYLITNLHVGRQEPQIKRTVILLSLFSLLSINSVGEKKGSCEVVHTP